MKQTITFPCTVTFSWEPEEAATLSEPGIDEEFYLDSFNISGVDLSEFLTVEMENKLYEILKGQQYEP